MFGLIMFVVFVVSCCRMEKQNNENIRRYFDK